METPITKKIKVIDEKGNVYEATYPKRAKGLVKNGRARVVDNNTICLVCPPNNKMEDKKVSENIEIKKDDLVLEKQEITLKDILSRIDTIIAENSHIVESIKLATTGDIAIGLGNIVEARERTNQKALALLEKMYEDTTGKTKPSKNDVMESVLQLAIGHDCDIAEISEVLSKLD